LKLLDKPLKYLYKPNSELLLHDDFNVDYLSNSDRKQLLSVSLSTQSTPVHEIPAPCRKHELVIEFYLSNETTLTTNIQTP